MSVTPSNPMTTVTAPRNRSVGSYVGATTSDREIGSFVDVEPATRSVRQQAAAFLRSLREPARAPGREKGHGHVH